ncbi:MAG: glycosyltransferase family 2 protein [Bacteroidales bacterium]|nr:glycosyltransferase family 2 protein [Lachnoclostridium sp.]MCM1383458.1 glycosyltransferase family 2 protein [Lachnoclostridium sp.]MCM1464307.1 glycosyltransferase family 2 protein [Bacteroidales bacterium]
MSRSSEKNSLSLFYNIENCFLGDGSVHITGWALGSGAVEIQVLDRKGTVIESSITRSYRQDVMYEYDTAPICEDTDQAVDAAGQTIGTANQSIGGDVIKAGFQIKFPADAAKSFQIRFTCGGQVTTFRSSVSKAGKRTVRVSIWKRFAAYLGREGWKNTIKRIVRQFTKFHTRMDYPSWYKRHQPSKTHLERQRRENFQEPVTFSIVIPLYRTKETYLEELLHSVLAQTYPHWELCLADGSGGEHSLKEAVKRFAGNDERIHYQLLSDNLGIAGNTNAAIEMSTGDFVVLADHDDLIAPNALYECAKALQRHKDAEVLYTDEDKIDMSGKTHFEPNFKPDFNPDYLRSLNYICHMFVVKRGLLERVGLLKPEFDGAQDYDFILRCCEQAAKIYHIPKILYHWRCHMESTASNPESKLYAFEAGRKALEAHYKRLGLPAVVENAGYLGMYHTLYHWKETPLVSILIPNKDHVEDLKKCMDSIEEKSSYRNYEFIVIENNSTEERTFRYYEEIEKRPNVTVIRYQGSFNFSRINNFGEQYAKGEYLLLLNNDTEMMDENCLQEMLSYCMREDVGIVGARLWYEDDTIQHAGVIVGLGGVAGHAFVGAGRHDAGYQKRILCAQNYSAVTAACLMVKRSLYREVGGLTEEFEVAFNDIDFCLKVRALGKLVVYNPYAQLHHYESKSRGYEDTPEKIRRFQGEIEKFKKRWTEILASGDPYYNPNLTLSAPDFSLTEQ